MFLITKTINNVKQLVPLTADTGSGNPIGTILPLYKKVQPNGYLYCDGSTFDTTAYPGLYAYLGTNVLPDYRECAIVGAEQNTTDAIAEHDVYTQGQFKDDQLQNITGNFESANRNRAPSTSGVFDVEQSTEDWFALDTQATTSTIIKFNTSRVARAGDTTHGKRKAVYFYIKATTGLDEFQQDYVLNALNNTLSQQRSYSTEEHLTGGTWIDGKPIYRKVITSTFGLTEGQSTTISLTGLNIDRPINIIFPFTDGATGKGIASKLDYRISQNSIEITNNIGNYTIESANQYIIIEYTKTTD